MSLATWIQQVKVKEILLIIVLLIIVIGNFFDVIEDFDSTNTQFFFIIQILTIILSIGGMYLLLMVLFNSHREVSLLSNKISQVEKQHEESIQKIKTLAKAYNLQIIEQFKHWELSSKEQEIALQLLKGLSLKEIAELRFRSEKTVRQQASSIYRKSEVSGRNEFSAWFFEDLLSS